jgi:hypothetical protein
MNTPYWIHHYEANTRLNDTMKLPAGPCELPEAIREPIARSLAVFQLGESGGGTRWKRYAKVIAPLAQFAGYQRAIDLFVAEEQSHAAFRARCTQSLERFMDRLETKITKTLLHPAPDTAVAAAS